jgi:hypothetical protein
MSTLPTGSLFQNPIVKPLSTNGAQMAGCTATFYLTGTTNETPVYADALLQTPLSQPVEADASGSFVPIYMDPSVIYRVVLHTSTGVLISDTDPYVVPGTPSQAQIGLVLYPVDAQETAAGVTVVQGNYPYGYVDRYVKNVTPGTTPTAVGFNAAVSVASKLGCKVRWGASAPYYLDAPVNCTGIHGVIFEDESSGSASNSAFVSLIVGHTGHAFDLATSYECTFNNLAATTKSGVVANTLFFMARNTAGSGAGVHRFNNIRTPENCTFKFVFYGYGSEENFWNDCFLANNQPGSGIFSHNATNPSGFTSSFVTIATLNQSNSVHRHQGGDYFQFGNSGSQNECVFQLEGAADFTYRDGLWFCPNGLCYVEVVGAINTNAITFDSIRGEPAGGTVLYGVRVLTTGTTGVTSHSNWTFNNVHSDSVNELLSFVSTAEIQNLAMRASTAVSGKLLSVFNMSNSIIESLADSGITGQATGNVTNNVFIGGRNNITLNGAFSRNLYADNNLGQFGVDGDNFTSAATACTGALTASAQYTARLSPNGKQATLTLPAVTGTTTAASSFAFGVVLPTQFRPSANVRQPVIIEDNGVTPNQVGQVIINASTGAITVFKDVAGSGTFTNGGTGGFPGLTELQWNL